MRFALLEKFQTQPMSMASDDGVQAQAFSGDENCVSGDFGDRNVVFLATERNNVYAYDAESLALIWHRSLGPNDQTRMGSAGCDSISPDGIGIEATRTRSWSTVCKVTNQTWAGSVTQGWRRFAKRPFGYMRGPGHTRQQFAGVRA